uniref:Uncharacterized protein n=1 Tax=Mus musculus TaxID=10090 RepID=Q3V413_MOUSE|nr:unnamed protein product [Mus musculus]
MEAREDGDLASWNSISVLCRQCEDQDPRYSPYMVVRIAEAEMRAYHRFLGSCTSLEYRANKALPVISTSPKLDTRLMPAVLQSANHR